ncbi:MAG TPA: type I DNA topoisomerase [Alphaproteobacteria bacterium]|nr:type I DNA topoisomerase [Alphaproteobacteria bacterium]
MKNLVVVESPTKSKTIERYLGPDFTVLATVGHFRDLDETAGKKYGGVDPDNDFSLSYAVYPSSKKILSEIVRTLKGCERLILATDPDREGEAIAWHLHEYLTEKKALTYKTVHRVVFHEITKKAVQKAFKEPRDLDLHLVNAAQARRALDMILGFGLSEVLRHKLPGTKRAGRVQSPTLRLTCEREEEIENFVPREHWTVDADLRTQAGNDFKARLTHLDGTKLEKFSLADEAAAQRAVGLVRAQTFTVASVKHRQIQKRPSAPFRTSTLQQVASRILNMSPKHSAGVAQHLFQEGLITYMRTDSVTLSSDAISSIRAAIENSGNFGKKYLPAKPKYYTNKIKNAQEAHEAIRPTDITRTTKGLLVHLKRDAVRLYDLIWKRTMASQMENGLDDQLSIDIGSFDQKIILHAAGSTVVFDGFRKLYNEEKDNGSVQPKQEDHIPDVKSDEPLKLDAVSPAQHYTKPPARYNEASLIAKLEELGIGRPSTYPTIISTLLKEYVTLEDKQLIPQGMGRGVVLLLESSFESYVDYAFTAELEDKLDEISNGRLAWKDVLEEFYGPFSAQCESIKNLTNTDILNAMNEWAGARFFPIDEKGEIEKCPKCKEGKISFKWNKQRGPFIGCVNFPDCKYTLAFSKTARDGLDGPRILGKNGNGQTISLRRGPYGHYVQQGEAEDGRKPKRIKFPDNVEPKNCDLEIAIKLLSLPRLIGNHPETAEPITVTIGRYGPYINHNNDKRSLSPEDDVLTVGINRAVSLLGEPKQQRRGTKTIRSLGAHPEDGNEVAIYEGRYGYYIKNNKTTAGLPKHFDVETITLDEAVQVLAEKASKPKKRTKKKGHTTKRKRKPRPKKID